MVANHKLRSLHDELKKEYMELVDLCVCSDPHFASLSV
jgi:hypothetical protein